MKYFLLSVILFVFTTNFNYQIIAQNKSKDSLLSIYKPKNVTVIDLDREIETQKVPVKVIYDGISQHVDIGSNNIFKKEFYINHIINIVGGPDSTLYVLDNRNKRIVQMTQDGDYIRSIGKPGGDPGEFMEPVDILNVQNRYIYVPDPYFPRLQIFDINGNYLRTIKNLFAGKGGFSIGKNGMIFTLPREAMSCPLPPTKQNTTNKVEKLSTLNKPDKFLILIHDSLGKELKKIGTVKGDDPDVFQNNRWSQYYILTNENVDFIWCVFRSFPLIRKYDFNGNFIEEIRFKSNYIDTLINKKKYNDEKIKRILESDKELAKKYKNISNDLNTETNTGSFIEIIIPDAKMLPNGDLIMNISHYGNIQLSGDGHNTKVVRKYKFTKIQKDDNLYYNNFNFSLINGAIFGYSWSGIIKEVK